MDEFQLAAAGFPLGIAIGILGIIFGLRKKQWAILTLGAALIVAAVLDAAWILSILLGGLAISG